MKTFAAIITTIAVVFAGMQWWQIFYRLHLFYGHYHSERYVNHVGGDVFTLIHVVNSVLLFAALFSLWTLSREPRAWHWLVTCIAAANVLGWLTFTYMHSTGVLVGYEEFIRHWKGLL